MARLLFSTAFKKKRESWHIAAARFCVEHAESGFTKKNLSQHLKKLYDLNQSQIDNFFYEEIHHLTDKKTEREPFDPEEKKWTPPLSLILQINDFDEKHKARKNTKMVYQATFLVATIAVIAIVVGHIDNQVILKQSQEETLITNKAYVSITSIGDDEENPNLLSYRMENTGNTPAIKVREDIYLLIDGDRIDWASSHETYLVLNPKQARKVSFIKPVQLDKILDGSNNFLVIDISYEDYSGQQGTFETKIQFDDKGDYLSPDIKTEDI